MNKGVLAVVISILVISSGFAVWFFYVRDSDGDGVPDFSDAFPNDSSEWRDSDGDGVGDNGDAFPNDASETADFDGDGVGDNADTDDDDDSMPDDWEISYNLNPRNPNDATDDEDNDQLMNVDEYEKRANPRNPDTDTDTVIDGFDIDPAVDTIVVFQYIKFKVEDPIDIGTEGDVYFTIAMDGYELTSSVIYYDTNAADVPADYAVIFNVPDSQTIIHFRTTWFDRDFLFDDKLDASGIGTALDVNYSLIDHTWSGDDDDGMASGNDDGSTTWDEDDITVWYQIFDSVAHPDEIENVLAAMGSDTGLEDFGQAVRTMGHVILEQLVQWALDHPDFFAQYGSWGSLLASGLQILAIVVKFYRLVFLQNDDK